MAAALAEKIGDAEIVFDPDPDSPIRSPWRTFRHLFETTPDGATHRAQIQDDAVVCRNYRRAVELAVEAQPDRLLVLFVGGNPYVHSEAVKKACARDVSWAELEYGQWCPAVATCWPCPMICEFLEWEDRQNYPEKFISDDERVGRFLREYEYLPLATVPSLADHPDMNDSLIGRRNSGGLDTGRIAACWIGDCDECDDPTLIDWTVGP